MPAGLYSFTIEQGASFSLAMTWSDETGALVNLTGYTAKLEIRDQPGGTLILRFSTSPAVGEGTITLGGVTGTITLAASAAITDGLAGTVADALVYDLELTSGSTVTRLLEGAVTVSGQVTV